MEKAKISHAGKRAEMTLDSRSRKKNDYDDDITSSAYKMRRSEKIEVK